MRLLLALLVLLSTGGMALAQHNAVTLTKIEARAMTPEALTRRIFGGLAPLMLPIADRGHPGVAPTRPLTRLFFYTLPTAAMAAGMCRTEFVAVEFEPAGPPAGADTRVRARRITSQTAYFVRDLARLRAGFPNEDEAEDQDRVEAACAAIDPRRAHIIGAAYEYQLDTALPLLLDLAEAARAGRALVPVDCDEVFGNDPPPTEAQCLGELALLAIDHVSRIQPCDPPVQAVCHRVDTGGSAISLTMTANNRQLAGVRIQSMILSASAPID